MRVNSVRVKRVHIFPGMVHHHVFVNGREVPDVREVHSIEQKDGSFTVTVLPMQNAPVEVYETDSYVVEPA